MPDREKVIKGLECCIRHGENAEVGCGRKDECPYEQNGLKCWLDLNRDALALLKEQNGLATALEQSNAVNEYLNAEVEELKGFINGFSKDAVVPVRCKDCKHRYDNDQKCPFCNECGGRDYPGDDWFCADGERKSD